jgi:hypothetical protein
MKNTNVYLNGTTKHDFSFEITLLRLQIHRQIVQTDRARHYQQNNENPC